MAARSGFRARRGARAACFEPGSSDALAHPAQDLDPRMVRFPGREQLRGQRAIGWRQRRQVELPRQSQVDPAAFDEAKLARDLAETLAGPPRLGGGLHSENLLDLRALEQAGVDQQFSDRLR